MDAVDLEEASAGDGVVKQSSKPLRPGARSVNGTRFTVERVHEPEIDGTSSSPAKPQHGLKSCEKTDLQPTSSLVSNVTPSSEDILSPNHSKEDAGNSSHDHESEISSRQDYQDRLQLEIQKLEEENEKALLRHKEMLAQRLEESVKQLETDQVCYSISGVIAEAQGGWRGGR